MFKIRSYSNIVELAQPGVFALVHVRTGTMYITYSNNMLTSISSHISRAKIGTHECAPLNKQFKNLRLYVLEYCEYSNIRVRHAYWYNLYKALGHKLYNRVPPVQYKARVIVTKDFFVHVELINKNKDILILGVFDKISDANEFCTLVNSQVPIAPMYATNELTRKYVEVQ